MEGRNRLRFELSPYLRQHMNNPVDWHPWGSEAIQRARSENRMIFLSIGYSTCHWCHVMERESFENNQVAKVMNQNFINIKIDREERPDVDKVYMTFVQATTGSGGWPLSVFLTPGLKPVYGGTYFPPTSSFGRPGFTQILEALAAQWREDQDELVEAGDQVMAIIEEKLGPRAMIPAAALPADPAASVFQRFFAQLAGSYDPAYGGYGGPPKFPQPTNLLAAFRLHCWPAEAAHRRKRELEMNLHTLDMMARGGIHDHIGGGFARYSTDGRWHVPHFEKMLYDQAQLLMAYTVGAQLTAGQQRSFYADVVADIVSYVGRYLTHPAGGFFSAEDADSWPVMDVGEGSSGDRHKKEGAFCVWTAGEIRAALGDQMIDGSDLSLADLIIDRYHVREDGNVDPRGDPHGELRRQNVLTELAPLGAAKKGDSGDSEPSEASRLLAEQPELYARLLARARQLLLEQRLTRPQPDRDDKILCSWNGLMISGLARAGSGLGVTEYTDRAIRAARFLLDYLVQSETGELLRSVYAGQNPDQLDQLAVPITGFVDDYAFSIQGLLDLYAATLDASWLAEAVRLQGKQDELFLDRERGGYFTSKEGDEFVIIRLKEEQDGAEPASNSVSAMNLVRLYKLTGNPTYRHRAEQLFRLFTSRMQQAPSAVPALLEAFLFYIQDGPLLVFTGHNSSSLADNPLLQTAWSLYLFSATVVAYGTDTLADAAASSPLASHPLLSGLDPAEAGAILVEADGTRMPIRSQEELLARLQVT